MRFYLATLLGGLQLLSLDEVLLLPFDVPLELLLLLLFEGALLFGGLKGKI